MAHVYIDVQYILPQPDIGTVVVGVQVQSTHNLSSGMGYYGLNLFVNNDTSAQIMSTIESDAKIAFENEFGITIAQSDRVHIFGAIFR